MLCARMLSCLPKVTHVTDLETSAHDSIVLVTPDLGPVSHPALSSALTAVASVDKSALSSVTLVPVSLPCKRLVLSPTGPLDRDYDDVRWVTWLTGTCLQTIASQEVL